MTLLREEENIYSNLQDDEIIIPAVYKNEDDEMPLWRAFLLSTFVVHPGFIIGCLVIAFILALLGIHFDILNRPELPKKDIEFVLVSKEEPPIDKNTRFRADRDSRAGGKHDPTRPVSEPQASSPAPAKKAAPAPAPAPKSVVPPKKQPQPQPQPSVQKQPVKQPTPQPAPAKAPAKTPPAAPKAPVPTAKAPAGSVPKPTLNPKSPMQIPFPKASDYKDLAPAPGGPVSGTKKGTASGSATGTSKGGSSAPTPSFSPSRSTGTGSGAGKASSGKSSGGTGSSGNYGNPGPGNTKGTPGIDAVREPDFGPYMKELQRRIKMNWTPPKGNESKRVVLLFTISRDGRLLNVKIHKSSGLQAADQAAIQAVQLTAPFKPLPPNYKGDSVDIQFTFDYNVFGASRY